MNDSSVKRVERSLISNHMKQQVVFLAGIFLFLASTNLLFAQCILHGHTSQFTQPNGQTITVVFHGSESYARTETQDGYTIVFDQKSKAYHYAILDANQENFLPSGNVVGIADPAAAGIPKSLRLKASARRAKALARKREIEEVREDTKRKLEVRQQVKAYREHKAQKASNSSGGSDGNASEGAEMAPPVNPPTLGDVVGLTILVDFSDEPARADVTRAGFDDYCNKPGGNWSNNGSVYDYFYIQSGGRLRYTNNVTYYVRVPNTYAYYNDLAVSSGTNGRRLITDAVNQLKAEGYDFSGLTVNASNRVIATNLLWAGNDGGVWAKGLWPHRWVVGPLDLGNGTFVYDYQCTDIGTSGYPTIGTFCHEDGHMIGKYPDYYDTDGGEGVGRYCLMGSGNHATQTNPTNISSYLKYHSGWADAIELTSLSTPVRLAHDVDSNIMYKYTNTDPSWTNEYFIIENRSKVGGWEAASGLPDSGLLISHAHEAGGNSTSGPEDEMTEADHYEHSIEQADGLFQLEGQGTWGSSKNRGNNTDLFHSGGTGPNTEFSDSTTPNAKWWKGATGAASSPNGTNSNLHIHSISAAGSTMTFVYGTGTPSGNASTRLTRTILENSTDFGQTAPSQTFCVYNGGGGTATYAITDNVTWLACTPASGTATTETDTITVNYTTSGLSAGTYNGTITVNGGTAGTETIAVTLTVRPQATLSVNPTSLSPIGTAGFSGPVVSFELTNTGGGTAAYTLSKTQAWLTLDRADGSVTTERDTITVTCDATALSAGIHNDTITLTAPGATNSPLTVPVSFSVQSTDMIVTSPNGGERWTTGSTNTITWGSSLGGTVKIELFKGGALNSTITESAINNGSFPWPIPGGQTPGADYRVVITSNDFPAKSDSSNADFTIKLPPIYYADMETDPGWTLGTSWAYGQPTGSGQDAYGNPDPTSGSNGSNVIGYRLDGDYEGSITSTRWATTPSIDCTNYQNITLSFMRWLGVEQPTYDHAYIQVSNNGSSWTQVWTNTTTVDDGSWTYCEYDISAVADGQSTVYIRWGLGTTDSSWNYAGWNLDEVMLSGDSTGPSTYSVTYNANGSNGGTVPVDSNSYLESATVTVLGNTGNLTKGGSTFVGWNTASNGNGTSYSAGNTFTMGTSNVTLYAEWTALPTYTVSYNGNENTGGAAPADQTKVEDVDLTLATEGSLVRTGYNFSGWNTAANGSGTPYASGGTYSTNAALSLFAQWSVASYTVTFDGNEGGTPSPTSKSVTYNSTYGALATVTRTGYAFNGWFTQASGGTQVTSGTTVTDASDHTLYAHWTANTYTVTFAPNGGDTPSPTSKPVTFGSTYGTLATVSRTGYTFLGWFTQASGGTEVTSGTNVTDASDHPLYAQWNANPVVYAGDDQTVSLTGQAAAWTPADIATVAWFDADDATTIAETGGAVSQWNDKSGNNYHATQSNGTYQPVYSTADTMLGGKPSVGTNGMNAKFMDIPQTSSKRIYVITYFSDGVTDTVFPEHCSLLLNPAASDFRIVGRSGQGPDWDYSNMFYDPVGGEAGCFKNGGTVNNETALPMPATLWKFSAPATRTQTWKMLCGSTSWGRWNGAIAELIFTDGTEDAATQQKMEGYLAHKWGLEGNLPAEHPYKASAPMKSVPSATAYLDSAWVTDADDVPTTLWSVVDKPVGSAVVFDNDAFVDTFATFDMEGVYTLRLTADDGHGPITDDVIITVGAGGVPIADASLPAGISLYGYTGENSIDALTAFQTLIDNSQLSLVRWVNPSNGNIKELYYTNFPSAGWVNEIGDLTLGSGYVIKTPVACTLSITGNKSTASLSHNLPSGYSIVGFNQETPLDAQTAFQPLIDAGKLDLVRWVNPSNGAIKELYYTTFPSSGWVNEIGNLTEGQGYIIKLNAAHSGFNLP